jgi:amidohydrolase
MKKQCNDIIDQQTEEILALGRKLFVTPELGFKEFKTKEILVQFLKEEGFTIEKEYFETGFQVSIGSGHPHIGLIAELDAIPTLGHPYANLEDQSAAHACGHSTQCAIMVNALLALKKAGATRNGKVTCFFTPAEEFTDIQYRRELIKVGKIDYLAGKINMLMAGVFDDVDVCIHLHAMGDDNYRYSVNSDLAGFIYKKYIFKGKASHAAVLPHMGINALNAFALFQSASAMLRETFVDEDKNRVHGIVTEGGQTVNSIPEQVVYESYIRSFNANKLKELSNQYTNTAKHCALALNAECVVEDIPGYLPFNQDRNLSSVIYENLLEFAEPKQISDGEKSVAAGDIGDLGNFIPSAQFGYGGFRGLIHGKDMCVDDEERVYVESAKVVAMTCIDLLEKPELVQKIMDEFAVEMSLEEYQNYIEIK